MTRELTIGTGTGRPVRVGGEAPLCVIAGPCVIEDADLVLRSAERLADLCRNLELGFVFKSSYLKDNRTSVASFTDRKSTRLNSSHSRASRMPSSA